MKRLFVLAALALASFSVYWFAAVPSQSAVSDEGATLRHAGLAWVDGNASSAFFVVNSSRPASIDVHVFADTIPSRVWIWDESDQARFAVFADELERRLSSESIDVSRGRRSELESSGPAVLVVVGSAMPSELMRDDFLSDLLDRGWVVAYSGFPFSWVRTGARIESNARWFSQRERLGVDFDRLDAVADYRLSIRHGSLRDAGPWQVFARHPGFLAVWPALLDASFSDADDAAVLFSDFISRARWSLPLASFSSNVTTLTTFFSPVMPIGARHALVFLERPSGIRRESVTLAPPDLLIIHPSRLLSNSSVTISILSNLSKGESFELSFINHGRLVRRYGLGDFSSGLSWHSRFLDAELVPGDYVISVTGSRGHLAYSQLHVFSYRADVSRVDAASKSVVARLWAGDSPTGDAELEWRNRTVRTDSNGYVRLTDGDLSGGVNRRSIRVEGRLVFFEYSVQDAFLSSWTDRALLAGTVGLFGLAWFWQRHQPARIRLVFSGSPCMKRVSITPTQLVQVLDSVNARFQKSCVPLTVREFSAGLGRFFSDPSFVYSEASLERFFGSAAAAGHVYWQDGLVAARAWYPSEAMAIDAFFYRRLSDVLASTGWTFRRTGERVFCRKSALRMTLTVEPRHFRVRFPGLKKGLDLDALRERLAH